MTEQQAVLRGAEEQVQHHLAVHGRRDLAPGDGPVQHDPVLAAQRLEHAIPPGCAQFLVMLGLGEGQYDDLLNFETSPRLGDREKAALAYAEAITWRLETDDGLWDRLYQHFSEPELVELGCFIALTMGQQSWLRLLDIEHHEVLAGTTASMAPGFGTPEELATSKTSADYWARTTATQGQRP